MVETNLIITIVIVVVISLALLGFVIGTYVTQSVVYGGYTRPPLNNGVQPNGSARNLTQAEIDRRNAIIAGTFPPPSI